MIAYDFTYGVGIIYYIMPYNIFVNGKLGMGAFTLDNGTNQAESENGFSLHVKFGKEWWVSKNWGLGVSGGYGFISAHDADDPSNPLYSGRLMTNKIFVMFNTTYN